MQAAQRASAHCQSLAKQLQEAKEEILAIGSKNTAAARAARSSPGPPRSAEPASARTANQSTVIQFDMDSPPKLLQSPQGDGARTNDALASMQEELAKETKMKEQALAELEVARELAAKAMLLVEKAGTPGTSPSAKRDPPQTSQSPSSSGSGVSGVLQGWARICSSCMSQSADWLFSAKSANKAIYNILADYYDPAPPRSSNARSPQRPDARQTLDKICKVIDSRTGPLRRQEQELQSLLKLMQGWEKQTRALSQSRRR